MRIKNIFGREVNKSFSKYRIDWDKSVSKPQKRVKDLIAPYWQGCDVYEELMIPGSKLRVDLINFTHNVAIEVSPRQHFKYNEFLHKDRPSFLAAQKRDLQKIQWIEDNGFRYVEITDDDLKDENKMMEKIFNEEE